ncbi:MAG: hypothetical protein Q7R73_03535 [bacterium]|nr:hypothetical protein [bacterium]
MGNWKQSVYIFIFTLLGVFLQFILHGLLEIWYIGLLLNNFSRWSFGFSWDTWVLIHSWSAVALFFAGSFAGFRQGRYWWKRIYEKGLVSPSNY